MIPKIIRAVLFYCFTSQIANPKFENRLIESLSSISDDAYDDSMMQLQVVY